MDSDELRALIAVAATGSYHAAARSLGFSRSTLRRRIGELEARVGQQLVTATAQGVELTAAGSRVSERARGILREIQAMLVHLRMEGEQPAGELRLGAPIGLHPQLFHPVFSMLRKKFPKVRIRQRFFENPAQVANGELDVCIDASERPDMPGWITYELGLVAEVLLSSAAYLQRRGTPCTIEELAGHELISWLPPDRDANYWPASDGTFFPVEPAVICADNHVVHALAASGAGIALALHTDLDLPGLHVDERLVRVLPEKVRYPRPLHVRVSRAIADMPAFHSLLDFTKRISDQVTALRAAKNKGRRTPG